MPNQKHIKTVDVVLAALLTALSVLITFSPFKLPMPQPFSVTLGSHVPTMLALFINPFVAVLTVIGSCFGFWASTGNIIIVLRAAMHLLFSLVGWYMISKKGWNIFLAIIVTSLLHAGAEAVIVYFLTPLIFSDKAAAVNSLTIMAFVGTLFHHFVDCAITAPILYALTRAHLIQTAGINWSRFKGNTSQTRAI